MLGRMAVNEHVADMRQELELQVQGLQSIFQAQMNRVLRSLWNVTIREFLHMQGAQSLVNEVRELR